MTFLKNTINDVITVGVSSIKEIFKWVYAAYAVHENMRSQTGGEISMGYGMLHFSSRKLKLNTKRSD